MAAIWVVFGHSAVISNIEKWSEDCANKLSSAIRTTTVYIIFLLTIHTTVV